MAITIKGIDFIDSDGVRVRNFSLISDDTGYAVAIADFNDDNVVRFAFMPEFEYLMPHWIQQVKGHLKHGVNGQGVPYKFSMEDKDSEMVIVE